MLIASAFNYDAHASELTKLGPLPILKARMNPDVHMADDLKNTCNGNLFVVFGEPDLIVRAGAGSARPRPHPHHRRGRVRSAETLRAPPWIGARIRARSTAAKARRAIRQCPCHDRREVDATSGAGGLRRRSGTRSR